MKFGKLLDLNEADFSFPEVPQETKAFFERLSKSDVSGEEKQLCEIQIGCPAWSCKEWIGKIYPVGAKSKDFLKYYGNSFDTIELNTTYYRTPDLNTLLRWKSMTPNTFQFCPKISKQISHSRRLNSVSLLTEEFCQAFNELEEQLGSFFLQLPPNFTTNEVDKLEAFILNFPKGYQLAVEFRHESWFAEPEAFKKICNLLEEQNMLTCISDVAGRRDVLHLRVTTDELMVRFVGNKLHPSDYTRITDWVQQIKTWADQGLKKVYFFIHQPEEIECPDLADFFVKELKKAGSFKVKAPRFKTGGVQSSLF
ncbi:DUF72 domain-containing protein [Chondrinema litorale]|uniref:DUF72 domain-containing protein n=1 Tax=Chondrinema litorale TaxID=2994555 RepID=UPI002543A8B1|nr:DUF72 domain-containing protein [Chondrinema litorale]UZR94035.1 DUF72 domain-containing protein [Chondrinema litorale]